MSSSDAAFVGSIPALYDRHLGPLLFAPYAEDIARRAAASAAVRILEIAAGTGIVTRALAAAVPPGAAIVATDLNAAMIEHAARSVSAEHVRWQPADAMSLPFDDASFDLVVCQFGAMFFPDRVAAFGEALRTLAPGGRFLLNVWRSLADNEVARIASDTVAAAFPDDPPQFLRRTPYGFGDAASISGELRAAGFTAVDVERVDLVGKAASAYDPAIGFCQGSPLRTEIEARDAGRLAAVTEAVAKATARRYGEGAFEASLSANVFDAKR